MKFTRKLVTGAIAAAVLIGTAGTALAAPANTGWDDKNDVTISQGSDTTYVMMQTLSTLYNSSPGCKTDNAKDSATLGQCLTGVSQDATDTEDNWDHDVLTQMYPTGSGAGVNGLVDQNTTPLIATARSSAGPSGSGQSAVNFWGYAKDGLAIVTLAGRTTGNITKAQLQGIYNCSITTWGTIYGTADTTPIAPYGMNPSSGTYATFKAYLGFDPNGGACVKKLSDGTFPFENDTKPIINDAAGLAPNAIWWMSYAEWKVYPYKRQSADLWTLDGVGISNGTIANNTYGAHRFVYQVTKKTDATPSATGSAVLTGATSGPGGATRQFMQWTCNPKASHTTSNPYNGDNYYDDITAGIGNSGFQRIPAAERTNGSCELEPGV